MIPKTIHFCWFGGQPYPDVVQRCLASWAEILPDYTIMRWDESNAPLDNPFAAAALADQKWAFTSDAVRLEVLRSHGGVYLDTDMLLVKGLAPFLGHGAFLGSESDMHASAGIIGARPEHPLIQALCERYRTIEYDRAHVVPIPQIITEVLRDFDVEPGADLGSYRDETNGDICLYPPNYFYPFTWADSARRDVDPLSYATAETVAIHLWNMSWIPWAERPVAPYVDGENYEDAFKVIRARLRGRPIQRPTFYRMAARTLGAWVRQRRGR